MCVFGFCNYFLIKDVLGKPKNTKPTAERSCHTEADQATLAVAAAAEAEAAFNQHKRITWQRSLSCIAASDMGQEAPTAEAGEAENEKCLSKKKKK